MNRHLRYLFLAFSLSTICAGGVLTCSNYAYADSNNRSIEITVDSQKNITTTSSDITLDINSSLDIIIKASNNSLEREEISLVDKNAKNNLIQISDVSQLSNLENSYKITVTGMKAGNTVLEATIGTKRLQLNVSTVEKDKRDLYHVTEDYVNFRKTPELISNNVITTLTTVNEFEVLDELTNWYKIKYGNQIGYVSKSYVAKVNEKASNPVVKTQEVLSKDNIEKNQNLKTAYITDSDVSFRSSPKISPNTLIGYLGKNTVIKIFSDKLIDGNWYKVLYNNQVGYVYKTYVGLNNSNSNISNNEIVKINIANIDKSYKDKLVELKKNHPNWEFIADHTGLDWREVINKELGDYNGESYNVVEYSARDEFKANPDDKSRWTPASKEAVEYFMDPRNFLDEDGIFQFVSSKYNENIHNKTALFEMIRGSFLDSIAPNTNSSYTDLIMKAAKTSNVSPYMLASMILNEQGYSGSPTGKGTVSGYNGYYNYFNIGAYEGANPNLYAAQYAKEKGWNNPETALIEGAKWFASNYINNNQYTPYLKKFNVMNGMSKVATHQYMTNVAGASQEGRHQANIHLGINNMPLVFNLPVFLNMPGNATKENISNSNAELEDRASKPNSKVSSGGINVVKTSVSNLVEKKTITASKVSDNKLKTATSQYRNRMIHFGDEYYYINGYGQIELGKIYNEYNGKYYYIDPNSHRLAINRWVVLGGKQYFASGDGSLYRNRYIHFGDKSYYMGDDCAAQLGFIGNNNKTYYIDPNTKTKAVNSWIVVGNKHYFAGPDGALYKNQFIHFGNKYYYMDNEGVANVGYYEINGKTHFIDPKSNFRPSNQWVKVDGVQCFFGPNGLVYKNQFIHFGDKYYYSDNKGGIHTGIIKNESDNKYYYIDPQTKKIAKNQWVQSNGKKYFASPTGAFYVNRKISFGKVIYQVDEKGIATLITGSTNVVSNVENPQNSKAIRGVDLSYYNTVTDWRAVKNSGIEFAFIRSSGTGAETGRMYKDSKFDQLMQGAQSVGIKTGIYHYSQAINEAEARAEARYAINIARRYRLDYPVVLDMEFYHEGNFTGRNASISNEQRTKVALAFLDEVRKLGYQPMFYSYTSFMNNSINMKPIEARYPVWVAQYNDRVTYGGKYKAWQYTSSGTVPGINGRVDMNLWYK